MAVSLKVINADVSVDMSYVYELAKQYDHLSRKYRVIITDKGKPVTLTGQESILMRMQADGESTPYVNKWLEWEDGNIVFTFTSFMLSKIGLVKFEFVVYDTPGGTAVLSTRQCNLKIEKSLIDYDGLIASEDFDVLSDIISQGLALSDLIADANTSIEQINNLIVSVNAQMAAYQTGFTTMSQNVQDLMTAVTDYMANVENAAAASAKLSESWAIGYTGTRVGEDTNNSKYHSDQSKAEADRAKTEADKAAIYAGIVIPTLTVDFTTGHLSYPDSTSITFSANYSTGRLDYVYA